MRDLGHFLGLAYQVADDISDVHGHAEQLGKPTGQDNAQGRPNVAHAIGLKGATDIMNTVVESAIKAIPACPGAHRLEHFVASWINHHFARATVLANYRGAGNIR
jgi:geranylgeranyl diphosphate synthase type II